MTRPKPTLAEQTEAVRATLSPDREWRIRPVDRTTIEAVELGIRVTGPLHAQSDPSIDPRSREHEHRILRYDQRTGRERVR